MLYLSLMDASQESGTTIEGREYSKIEAVSPTSNYNANGNVEEGSGDNVCLTFYLTLFYATVLQHYHLYSTPISIS